MRAVVRPWLPPGKRAAVCFTIDDVHPGRSTDPYEAGGDLDRGALRHVRWLLERHPSLRVTLFTTPDWREISPVPTRVILARIPWIRDRVYLAPVHPKGTMRLDRHPEFVRYLRELPRTEVALHGLHHVHRGPRIPVEFQDEDVASCRRTLADGMRLFRDAGLAPPTGMTPPGWNLPPALARAMVEVGLRYVASARDIRTPVSDRALAAMSGATGVPLIAPALLEDGRLVHLPTNFQATSDRQRAVDIVRAGGLLSIKAHIVKNALGHVALDGLDEGYRDRLHDLFSELESEHGDALWWATMGEIAERVHASLGEVSASTSG